MTRRAFSLCLFVVTLRVIPAHAEIQEASSCRKSDVYDAVSAASPGDTVTVPEGECPWSDALSVPSEVTIQGAGPTKTIISSEGPSTSLFQLAGRARLTNIGVFFEGSHDTGLVTATGKGWRIDHCRFEHTVGGYGIWAASATADQNPAGLIDNCEFVDSRILVNGVGNSFSQQHQVWTEPANFGTEDAVYVEDCTHERGRTGNVIDGNRGGRYVFRFNSVINSQVDVHAVQSTTNRGIRSWEIYRNVWNGSSDVVFYRRPVFLRSGEGVIFDNTITGAWSVDTLHLDSRRAYDAVPTLCDGTQDMDGNRPGENGWLCRDIRRRRDKTAAFVS